MNRRELVEALTVERFSRHVRADTRDNDGPDWWAAYARLGLAEAVNALPESDPPLLSPVTGKAMA